mmetsp:Transcript_5303/g.15005  ORF Transcript_5303/g.15005 Transcript_5303/m.15005 type:complete len:658 (+) Transcript_5303:60-2033(+)
MYAGPARAAAEVQWHLSRPWVPGSAALPAEYPGSCHLTAAAETCALAGSQWASSASRCAEAEYLGQPIVPGDGSANFCDYPPATAQVAAHAVGSVSFWRQQRPGAADVNPSFFGQMPGSYWKPDAIPSGDPSDHQEDDGSDPRWTLTAQATVSLDIPDLPYVVQFDPYGELVWVGTLGGRLQSYVLQWHGGMTGPGGGAAGMSPFTRFVAHRCAICHLLFDERGVISVGEDNVAYHQRGGLPMPFLDDSARSRMTIGENALRHAEWYGGKQLIVGSTLAKLFFIDVTSGRLSATLDAPHGTQTMCSTTCAANGGHEPSYVVVGGNDGQVSLVDKRKKVIVRTLRAHASTVTAMAEQDGTLVTCGGSNDGQGMFVPDSFLKVFDLRRLEQTMPVSFSGGAVQARFHPFVPNSLVILANSGAFQTCELSGGRVYNTRYMYCRSAPTDGAVSFDVSCSGECLVIADASGLLQLWQSKVRPPKINAFSMPVEMPPMRAAPLYPKLIDHLEAPCPHGCPSLAEALDGGPLLSAWAGADRCTRAIRPPVPLHPDVEANLQMNDFVGCARNVRGWRQNAVVSAVLSMKQCGSSPSENENPLSALSVSASALLDAADTRSEPEPRLPVGSSAMSVCAADCDSPSEAVRGVEQLIREFGDDDGVGD